MTLAVLLVSPATPTASAAAGAAPQPGSAPPSDSVSSAGSVSPSDSVSPADSVSPSGSAPRWDSAPRSDPAPRWDWPLEPPHAVVRPFIAPATPYSAGHRGIDIAAATGAVVRAPAGGIVSFAGFVVDRPVLSIQHDGGLVSSFEPGASPLAVGSVVHRGDPVGTVLAGHCDPVCLHFGVRLRGAYVSPLNYLGGIPRSVLLPTRRLP